MADHSHIEWTDATWNPITGCSIVSPGCTNCYAMRLAGTRLKHIPSRKGLTSDSKAGPVWNGGVRFNREWLDQPLRWKRPRMIFVCAHGDLFHENVPDEWIDQVFAVMALAPQHTFQVLTKRGKRMKEYLAQRTAEILTDIMSSKIGDLLVRYYAAQNAPWPGNARLELVSNAAHIASHPHEDRHLFHATAGWPLPNVWLGVSAERQQEADERIPDLLATPAAIRFLSAEPLLGPIDLRSFLPTCALHCQHGCTASGDQECHKHLPWLDWIIVGGESGLGARPMHPDWARGIRDQCADAGVPFFFKQWGSWKEGSDFSTDAQVALRDGRVLVPDHEKLAAADREAAIMPHNPTMMRRVGKKAAGRLLDGIEHNGMPIMREEPAL